MRSSGLSLFDRLRLVAATLTLTLVAGCAVGPTPDRPDVNFDLDEPYAADLTTQPPLDELGGWWTRYGDETTADLVRRAVGGNLDLRVAAARVREGRALLRQAFGARLPVVSGGFTRDRRKQSLELPSQNLPPDDAVDGPVVADEAVRTSILSTTYDLGVDVSWQIDLFGGLRRAEQAARFEFLAAQIDRTALLHTIVAETIRARVAVATLQQRLSLAQDNLESLRDTLRATEERYRRGVGDPLSLRLARENVASALAQIPPLESDLRTTGHALSVLVGERPGSAATLPETLAPLPTLPPPPVGLPASLLDRRPDLVASDLRSRAATARVGVAIADLFPQLTIGAGAGYQSSEIGDLFDPESQIYNLLLGVVQPIFEGGRRRAAVSAARAQAAQATSQYASDVLNAIREAEDALVREATGRAEAAASEEALEEAEASEDLARSRYRQGLASLLDVFEAERRRRAAEERLALSRQKVWDARTNLHLALGGDWELPRSDAATGRTGSADTASAAE